MNIISTSSSTYSYRKIAETKLKSWKFKERDSLELPIDVDIYLWRKSIWYDDIDRGTKKCSQINIDDWYKSENHNIWLDFLKRRSVRRHKCQYVFPNIVVALSTPESNTGWSSSIICLSAVGKENFWISNRNAAPTTFHLLPSLPWWIGLERSENFKQNVTSPEKFSIVMWFDLRRICIIWILSPKFRPLTSTGIVYLNFLGLARRTFDII